MLKYSPEHMHCLANIYGALAPPNTGVLAVQSTAANQKVEPRLPSIYTEGSLEEWRFLYNSGHQQDCNPAVLLTICGHRTVSIKICTLSADSA